MTTAPITADEETPLGARVVNLTLIAEAGERRTLALAAAEREVDTIVDELHRARFVGANVNLTQIADAAGVARATLYRRLRATTINDA